MQLTEPVRSLSLTAMLLLAVLTTGCATVPRTADGPDQAMEEVDTANDPLESFNRAMYTFNDKLDRYLLKPAAKGYRAVVPRPARKGVSNFFSNLREPGAMVNNVLQGKFDKAGSSLGRFLMNSTIGLFGLFDVATYFGLERYNEDFGQTLGVWGVGEGPYLVLPFFGPSSFRDGAGLYADTQMYPPVYLDDAGARSALYATEAVDTRAQLLEAGDILEQAAGDDPYVFVREAYRQRRRALIKDGAAAEPAPLDFEIFEEEEPPAPMAPVPLPRE